MWDFTFTVYKQLVTELAQAGYQFKTFAEFLEEKPQGKKQVILRHDVDRSPEQALKMATMERKLGAKASYYFRRQKDGFAETFIRDIVDLGHEIGYHYEDVNSARGDLAKAIATFGKNLADLRKLAQVKTICMHGSPLGKHDNRLLWKGYDYRSYGIIGEPYFDLDFSEVIYLTDTGRRWNGDKVNIRDRAEVKHRDMERLKIKETPDLIHAIYANMLPDHIMLNAHPHRWFDFGFNWIRELIVQNMKNVIKAALIYLHHD
jgi:hypothetical protein